MTEQLLGALGAVLVIAGVVGIVATTFGAVIALCVALILLGALIVWSAWVLHHETKPTSKGGAS